MNSEGLLEEIRRAKENEERRQQVLKTLGGNRRKYRELEGIYRKERAVERRRIDALRTERDILARSKTHARSKEEVRSARLEFLKKRGLDLSSQRFQDLDTPTLVFQTQMMEKLETFEEPEKLLKKREDYKHQQLNCHRLTHMGRHYGDRQAVQRRQKIRSSSLSQRPQQTVRQSSSSSSSSRSIASMSTHALERERNQLLSQLNSMPPAPSSSSSSSSCPSESDYSIATFASKGPDDFHKTNIPSFVPKLW